MWTHTHPSVFHLDSLHASLNVSMSTLQQSFCSFPFPPLPTHSPIDPNEYDVFMDTGVCVGSSPTLTLHILMPKYVSYTLCDPGTRTYLHSNRNICVYVLAIQQSNSVRFSLSPPCQTHGSSIFWLHQTGFPFHESNHSELMETAVPAVNLFEISVQILTRFVTACSLCQRLW